MEQEHILSYKAGITRKPSDFLCSDGELAECINLTTDNEELKPIVQPAEYITNYVGISGNHRPVLVYVHKVANRDNYIGYLPTNGNRLCSGTVSDRTYNNFAVYNDVFFEPGTSKITSVGKTLILTDSNGMRYLLWNPDRTAYKDLKYKLPELDFSARIHIRHSVLGPLSFVSNSGKASGIIEDFSNNRFEIADDKQEDYNDLVVGLYEKNLRSISQKKGFSKPFLLRAALELYDGSYYYITNPILLFPAVTRNSFLLKREFGDDTENKSYTMYSYYGELIISQHTDFSDYSDIVKDVVLFASNGIDIYDVSVDQPHEAAEISYYYDYVGDRLSSLHQTTDSSYRKLESVIFNGAKQLVLKERDKEEILNDIKSTSLFYKLCSIGFKPVDELNTSTKIETHTLENLTTQERIENDDYYSRCKLFPALLYPYNSRLNLANVERGFFEGFDYFMPFDDISGSSPSIYYFYVRIKSDGGYLWVGHSNQNNPTKQKQGCYFYYPDSRADRVVIYKGNTCILDADLTEHKGLNGAYYLYGLPGIDFVDENTGVTPEVDPRNLVNNNKREYLSNYIITSEVNNPWVYLAAGYNKVGTGKIIGLSENTMALSQDAYGRNDLLIFSESGLWGMSVDRTGMFDSVHPYSREVCINEKSITKVDWGTLFISKKGLMLVTDQGVRCVSELMNGQTFNTASLSPLATGTDWADIVGTCQGSTTFLDYIRDSRCFLAYDYIDSRVLIINPAYGYQFVYSMVDGTISKTILPQTMTSTVNNYPDNLLQGSSYVYSFYHKPREEEISDRQTAFLLTRPMKLAGPVSQASLRQLKNVGMWAGNSVVKTELYLSEDLQTWYNDISRHGAAARYYRIALYIKMLPTERLSGTILTAQDRRNNNIR